MSNPLLKNYLERGRGGERGAVMVEYAFTIGALLFVLIGLMDLSRLTFQKIALNYSMSSAARWGILGLTLTDPSNRSVKLSRERSIEEKLRSIAAGYGMEITPAEIRICPSSQPNCITDNAGGPNSMTVITVNKSVPMIFKSFALGISSSILIKNEPYS